ncbi:MAG: response regulator [Candidatus Rokubacteria bacterium]|nr:response regulator [Candidatus Rokubacteria bacterium]
MGRRDRFPSDALVGLHVLVVDDDPEARTLMQTVLEYAGALVTLVPGAREALRSLHRVTPDVLVTDIAMPDENGYWLIREVRALGAVTGHRLPTIAITAHSDAHGPERTLAAGFDAHLRKPVDPWELCRVIAALGRRD